MRPQVITTAVMSDDANGICVDQTTSGADDLTLDGALVSGGVATATNAQLVSIEGSGNNSGIDFTITGTDANGLTVDEAVTGSNGGTATSTTYFKTVTGIAVDGAVTGNVEIGWLAASGLVTKGVPVNWRQSPFNMTLTAELTDGTGGTFGMQYTVDDPEGSYTDSWSVDANWRDCVGLDPDTVSSTDDTNILVPVRGIRGKFSTGSTDMVVKFTIIQGQNG